MDAWDGIDRRSTQRWRVKKEVSIGDLIAIGAAAVAFAAAYQSLDKRVTLVENTIIVQKEVFENRLLAQKEIDRRQDEEALRNQIRIEELIRSLTAKFDRLVERTR